VTTSAGADPTVSAVHQRTTRPSPAARATRRLRVDPWGPLLALAALVVFLLHGFGGLLTRDLALYAYGGQQFAEGVPPYVSVLNRAGPLAHMVPGFAAMLARGIGTDDLLTMRLVMMLLSVAAVWLTYLLGRDAFASRLAGVAAAAGLLTFQGFVTYATGGPREKTTMLLLVVCALLAVVHRRWLWAGVAVALATLTWQPAFFVGTAAAVVTVLALPWRRVPGALARFVLGGALATAVVTGYFVAVGALQEFLDGFLVINADWTDQTGLREYLDMAPEAMADGFGWSLWLILVGLAATVLLALVELRGLDRHDGRRMAVIGLGAATVASGLWSLRAFNGWADAVFVLPLAAVGLGGLVHALVRPLPVRVATGLVAAYTGVALVAAGIEAHADRHDYLTPMRTEVDAVLAAAGPDVSVASVGAPQPLVFGQLTNPVRHQMFIAGLNDYIDAELPGGLDLVADEIEAARPTFITMDHPTWYSFMRPVIRDHYVFIGSTYDITWYVERSVGEEQVHRLRRILETGP
jgi:hypothetical protein